MQTDDLADVLASVRTFIHSEVVPLEVRIEVSLAGRHHSGAAGREALDQLGLGLGNALDRPEQLEVHRPDARDDADVRLSDLAELRDLAEPAHAHLGHQHARFRLEAAYRERQADLVVQAPLRPDRGYVRGAEGAEEGIWNHG